MTDTPVMIVTGAAGNVGRATVAALGAQGVRVVASDRGTAASLAHPGPEVLAVDGIDLGDPESCTRLVENAVARHGRLDGIAHTVGGFAMAPCAEGSAAFWEEMFRLNALTTLNLFRAALPAMPAGGSLVAISAGAALRAGSQMGAYAAGKAAVLRLVEAFADELKGEGVRVNAVLPGTIDTPQNRAAMPGADPSAWVKPAEVAAAIAFLLSPAASGITGVGLPVTGRT